MSNHRSFNFVIVNFEYYYYQHNYIANIFGLSFYENLQQYYLQYILSVESGLVQRACMYVQNLMPGSMK
jgi:hypothetical protein